MRTGPERYRRGNPAPAEISSSTPPYRDAMFSGIGDRADCSFVALLLAGCEKKEEAAKPGPPEVGVVEPLQQDVPVYEE